MKLSQAREYLPLVQAAAEGKTIQCKANNGTWIEESSMSFADVPENYRIKPEPKLRPWRPEEVPVGAMIRNRGTNGQIWHGIICYADINGFRLPDRTTGRHWDYSGAYASDLEHSTDNGATWKPCGVEE